MSTAEIGKESVDGFLEHFGVKGMKWGRRKDTSSGSAHERSAKEGDSEDFVRTADIAIRVRSGGLRSLSNKEIRDLVDRINLEQNFNRLQTPQAQKTNPMKTGINYVSKKVMKVGDMTVDTILKTAVQVNVETQKERMKIGALAPAKK